MTDTYLRAIEVMCAIVFDPALSHAEKLEAIDRVAKAASEEEEEKELAYG